MTKKRTLIASLLMMFVLLFATTTTAYAKTVYYPSSGIESGYCENTSRSSVCRFDNLPAGTMQISYFMETDRTMEIRFYRNSSLTGGYNKATLTNHTSGYTTNVVLPASGTYYVVACTSNNTATTFTYAYDLFRN